MARIDPCFRVYPWFVLLRGSWPMTHIRIFVFVAATVLTVAGQQESPPSHVFYHGKIVTVDPQFHVVEAMAIRDGRIVAVGTNADIVQTGGTRDRADRSRRQDGAARPDRFARARAGASMYEFDQPVPDMETIEDVLAYVRARAATTEPGQWITLSQVFITRLREQRYPTRAELDAAAPRHPSRSAPGPTPRSTRWRCS